MAAPTYRIPAGSPVRYCRGCRARIYWVEIAGHRKLKLNADGTKHRCPKEPKGVRP